jgi:peptidoglycan/xylan/chitin deacetylase (PgdA/CDA1 family)
MYHDVIESHGHQASGFASADAALYKLDPKLFDQHLRAIARAVRHQPVTVLEPVLQDRNEMPLLITFDDGGVSAYTHIADKLEERGWRGHFFVTAGYIGTPPFLNPAQIRELRKRGHVIGSHSYSHPLRMARCGWEELLREWKTSVEELSGILGEPVKVASIPGGQYARKVAEAASIAGIETLFTSEPVTRCHTVDRCKIYGRYTVQRRMPPQVVADLAAGKTAPRLQQLLWWNAKKVIKTLGGESYMKLREALARCP